MDRILPNADRYLQSLCSSGQGDAARAEGEVRRKASGAIPAEAADAAVSVSVTKAPGA
jgi:hypothetical protein